MKYLRTVEQKNPIYYSPVPFMRPKLGSNESLSEMPENSRLAKKRMESSENPQFILIEEMPGIGKYFLLKEIAYNWGI